MKTNRKIAIAIALLAVPVAVYAGKSDPQGRQVVTYEEAADAGTWTRPAPFPTQEKGGYARTAGCVEVACGVVGDGGILSLTVETDYELGVTTNSPVRLSNGAACVAFTSGTGVGKVVNEGSIRYWRAPAGTGTDGGMAKYECCALTGHSAAAPVIVQACPR